MDDAQAGLLGEFMSITGLDDTTHALSILEASNWVLEEAVNLFFATGGDIGVGGGGAAGGLRGDSGNGSTGALPAMDEDEIRAPLPVIKERLYGDVSGHHGIPAHTARYGAPPDRGPTHVDVFRDFAPESGAAANTSAAAQPGPSSAAAAASAGAAGNAPKLSDLFKPPVGLVFQGDWQAAGAEASKQGRWLLANVQSADEFATHRLNRDTWSDALVQDMLKGSFIFWQCYNTSDIGQQLSSSYHLDELPAVVIVDPFTGAKLWERYGFISAEALIEELVPFLDVGPNDPGASALAQRAVQQSAKRRSRAISAPSADNMTEDEQLSLALQMSVEDVLPSSGGGSNAAAAAAQASDDIDEQAIWQEIHRRQREEEQAAAAAAAMVEQPSAAPAQQSQPLQQGASAAATAPDINALQAAAAARLPAEPAEGAAGGCRVAFRLPDGGRAQRRFNITDTVAALQDYVISVSSDAAGLPSFHLSEARPGAAVLSDPAATIHQAGVAGAMLVIRSNT